MPDRVSSVALTSGSGYVRDRGRPGSMVRGWGVGDVSFCTLCAILCPVFVMCVCGYSCLYFVHVGGPELRQRSHCPRTRCIFWTFTCKLPTCLREVTKYGFNRRFLRYRVLGGIYVSGKTRRIRDGDATSKYPKTWPSGLFTGMTPTTAPRKTIIHKVPT